MNRQMNLYYHFFEKKNQLISTSCLFLWKNSLSLQWTTEWILVAFSKKKETSLYKLASFKRGQLIFRGYKNPKVKKTNESEWIKFQSCLCIPGRRSKALLSKWNWLKQLLRLSSTTWSPMSITNYHNWCFVKDPTQDQEIVNKQAVQIYRLCTMAMQV